MKAVIIVVGLAICGLLASFGVDEYNKSKAMKEVRSFLIDPDSAKFSEIMVTKDGACGTFNAKNLFGAYVGDTKFILQKGEIEYMPVFINGDSLVEKLEKFESRLAFTKKAAEVCIKK